MSPEEKTAGSEAGPHSDPLPSAHSTGHRSFVFLEIDRGSSDQENSAVRVEDRGRGAFDQKLNVSLQPISLLQSEPVHNLCSITDSLLLLEKSKQTQIDSNPTPIGQSGIDSHPNNHEDSDMPELELMEEDWLSSASDVRSIWLETAKKESKSSMNSGEIKDNSRSNTVHSLVINQKNSFSSQNFPIISKPDPSKPQKRNLCQMTLTGVQAPLKQELSNRNPTAKRQTSDSCDQDLMVEASGCESPFDELLVSDDSKITENILHKKVMFRKQKGHQKNKQISDFKPKVKCSETIFSKMKGRFRPSDELDDLQIFEVNELEISDGLDGDMNQNLLSYVSEIRYHQNESCKSDYTFREQSKDPEVELAASNYSYLNDSSPDQEEEPIVGILESLSFRPVLKHLSSNLQPVAISARQSKMISPLHEPFKLKPENFDRNYA